MSLPHFLASAVDSWGAFYDHHHLVSVGVRYLHLSGLIVGGGTALAADRQVLRAARSGPARRGATVASLRATHATVVPALFVVVATGLLMTASDPGTFLSSRVYWFKMALVGLLLANGLGLLAAERAATRERPRGWTWLGLTSGASLLLWLTILFVGVWLTVAA
jgi:hypothetical protein